MCNQNSINCFTFVDLKAQALQQRREASCCYLLVAILHQMHSIMVPSRTEHITNLCKKFGDDWCKGFCEIRDQPKNLNSQKSHCRVLEQSSSTIIRTSAQARVRIHDMTRSCTRQFDVSRITQKQNHETWQFFHCTFESTQSKIRQKDFS